MISTSRIAGLAVVASLLLTAACDNSLAPVWWAEHGPVDVVVRTDADLYQGRIDKHAWWGGWRIEISGHYEIENRGERSVWVTQWPVSLEGYFDGEWRRVCATGLILLRGSPMERLAPGKRVTFPFHIRCHSASTNAEPRWEAPDVEGIFRLSQPMIATRHGSDLEQLPDEMSVSNAFEVRVEDP